MKLLRTLISLFMIAMVGILLITTRPTKTDFAEYYVEQNPTGLGEFFDNTFKKIVMQKTVASDYLIFSVFGVDEADRYVGFLGHFFGKSSAEDVAQTVEDLINQVKENIGGE